MTKKAMKLIDPNSGRMECRWCGAVHHASQRGEGRYHRGNWQCQNGCRDTLPLVQIGRRDPDRLHRVRPDAGIVGSSRQKPSGY